MPKVTATEASRNFSRILDDVEHRQISYEIERHGQVIARIVPARGPNGAAIRAALAEFAATGGPDSNLGDEIAAVRRLLRDDSFDHVEDGD